MSIKLVGIRLVKAVSGVKDGVMARRPKAEPVAPPAPAKEPPMTADGYYDYFGLFQSTIRLAPLHAFIAAYRDYERYRAGKADYPSKAWIFKQIALLFWGPHNKVKEFVWHPWAEKMNAAAHEHPVTKEAHPHLAINGSGSSGKTEFGAIYALINWVCDPDNTLILATTTDYNAARRRIWGAIEKYFNAMPGPPGKLVSSVYRVDTLDRRGNKVSGQCGIVLVPGEKKKEKDCLEKMIGAKAGRKLILIADELPDLVQAILDTFFGNLITGAPQTQIVAMGNFNSRYDAFGVMCKPRDGWDSINIESSEWDTMITLPGTESRIPGYCIRFDGMKSPNILIGQNIYPIYGLKHYKDHKELGEKSGQFWRFCRSFEAPIGLEKTLYTEADFIAGRAYEYPVWLGQPTRISAMDPAFKAGGDRCVQYFGWYGEDVNQNKVIAVDMVKVLHEDVTLKDQPFDLQIANQFIANCQAERVLPKHAGIDATGGGGTYSHIWEKWSPEVLRIEFGGAPSALFVTVDDAATAKQRYDRRVSELWGVGKEFLRYGQLKGLDEELTREMKAREFEDIKRGDYVMTKVETKTDMKARIGFSPDKADAFFCLVEVCRTRLGAIAGGPGSGYVRATQSWQEQVEAMQDVYSNVRYEPETYEEAI